MPNVGKPLVNEDGSIGNCHYCQRQMLSRESGYDRPTLRPLHPTREHIEPRSLGGTRWVWACYQCNSIKGNRTEHAWKAYMRNNPRWWERKGSPSSVPAIPAFVPTRDQPFKPVSHADSMYILKHGKKAWRAAKAAGMPLFPRGQSPIKPIDFEKIKAIYAPQSF